MTDNRTDGCSASEKKKAYHSFKMTIHGFRITTQTSISKDIMVFWEVVRNVGVTQTLPYERDEKHRCSSSNPLNSCQIT